MMPLSLLMPLLLFSFVAAITPGPNNVMLASSGLNYGVRRTVPHMMGITVGIMLMLVMVGAGVGTLFQQWSALHRLLQLACAVYLLYLAWKIATAPVASSQSVQGKPFSFLQAAGLQWVNPKAWTFALAVVAVYVPPRHFFLNLCVAALACGLVNIPAALVWTLFGKSLRRLLQRPATVRKFNICMALLLVVSLWPMLAIQ